MISVSEVSPSREPQGNAGRKVADLIRLARDAEDLRRLLELFQNRGVVLVSAAEGIDSSRLAGRTRCQLASIFV